MTRRSPFQVLLDREAVAERRLAEARTSARKAREATLTYGHMRFQRALARRGITVGSTIVLDGQWSGNGQDVARGLRHDRTPVLLRSVRCTDRPGPASFPPYWWFRLVIARIRKDGTPRDEYRDVMVCGETPEDAAREVQVP